MPSASPSPTPARSPAHWRHQPDRLFNDNGGHGSLFTTFDNRLMMILHAPNARDAQPRISEMEDTGENVADRAGVHG